LVGGPWADGFAAELLRCYVRYRFGQLPTVAGEVLEGAVPFAVLPVDRRLQHDSALAASAGERCVYVGHPYPNDVGDTTRLRCATVITSVGDDHRTVIADG
jgi:hypothetical protein